eukprot:783287-Rhodomonas_salina.2
MHGETGKPGPLHPSSDRDHRKVSPVSPQRLVKDNFQCNLTASQPVSALDIAKETHMTRKMLQPWQAFGRGSDSGSCRNTKESKLR